MSTLHITWLHGVSAQDNMFPAKAHAKKVADELFKLLPEELKAKASPLRVRSS